MTDTQTVASNEAPPTTAAPTPVDDDDDGLQALYQQLTADDPVEEPEKAEETSEPDAAEDGAEKAEAEGKDKEESTEPKQESEPAEVIARPAAWNAEMEEQWRALPVDVQKYVTKREADAQRRISKLGGELKRYEPVTQVLKAHKHLYPEGWNDEQMVSRLMSAQALLIEDPVAGLLQIAHTMGIDPSQLGQWGNDDRTKLAAENAAYRVAERQRGYNESAASESATLNAIQEWLEGADREYYPIVFNDMVDIIPTIEQGNRTPSEVLDAAYAKAVETNSVVQSMIAKDKELAAARERESQRAERERKRTEDAARSQRLNAGAVADFSPDNEAFDLDSDDDMKALFRRVSA